VRLVPGGFGEVVGGLGVGRDANVDVFGYGLGLRLRLFEGESAWMLRSAGVSFQYLWCHRGRARDAGRHHTA
jgi:hypothetical protein